MIIAATRVILFVTVLITVILLFAAAKKLHRGLLYQILFLHILGVLIWTFFIFLNMTLPDFTGQWVYQPGSLGYLFEKLIFAGGVIWLSAQLWFFRFFPSGKKQLRWFDFWPFLIEIPLFVVSFFDNTLFGEIAVQPDGYSLLQLGSFTGYYSILMLFHFFWPLVTLLFNWRKAHHSIIKTQFRILFWSYLVFLLGAVGLNWVLPVFFGIFSFNALGPVFSLIIVLGMVYASNNYRFLDLRLNLQRALTYVSAGGIVTAMALTIFTNPAISRASALLIDTITILTALVAYSGLTRVFSPFFNLLIFRRTSNYRDILREASNSISSSSLGIFEAVSHMGETIKNALGIQDARLVFASSGTGNYQSIDPGNAEQLSQNSSLVEWFKQDHRDAVVREEIAYDLEFSHDRVSGQDSLLKQLQQEMQQMYIAAAIPIVDDQKRLIAVLLLNEKVQKQFFSTEEIRETKMFLDHMNFYIYNAQQYLGLQNNLKNSDFVQKEFMTGLFHEVRTPLTIAQSSVEALNWTADSQEREGYIAQATSHIQKSSKILADFSDILAIEQGKTRLLFSTIPLHFLVQNALSRLDDLIREKKAVVVLRNKDILESDVYVDVDRMTNVFTHVFHNSLIFHDTTANAIKIMITAKRLSDGISVSIKDNGIGIEDNKVTIVFEKLYKVDASRPVENGPGLGLSYCKAVVEAHQGAISLTSQPGKGTTVTIHITDIADTDKQKKYVKRVPGKSSRSRKK